MGEQLPKTKVDQIQQLISGGNGKTDTKNQPSNQSSIQRKQITQTEVEQCAFQQSAKPNKVKPPSATNTNTSLPISPILPVSPPNATAATAASGPAAAAPTSSTAGVSHSHSHTPSPNPAGLVKSKSNPGLSPRMQESIQNHQRRMSGTGTGPRPSLGRRSVGRRSFGPEARPKRSSLTQVAVASKSQNSSPQVSPVGAVGTVGN